MNNVEICNVITYYFIYIFIFMKESQNRDQPACAVSHTVFKHTHYTLTIVSGRVWWKNKAKLNIFIDNSYLGRSLFWTARVHVTRRRLAVHSDLSRKTHTL